MTAPEALREMREFSKIVEAGNEGAIAWDHALGKWADAIEAELKQPRFTAEQREALDLSLVSLDHSCRSVAGHTPRDGECSWCIAAATIRAIAAELEALAKEMRECPREGNGRAVVLFHDLKAWADQLAPRPKE